MNKKTAWMVSILKSVMILFLCLGLGLNMLMTPTFANPPETPPDTAIWDVKNESQLQDALNSSEAGDVIEINEDIILTQSIPLTIEKDIIIQSGTDNNYTILQSVSEIKHFKVNIGIEVTLQNIILDGNDIGGGISSNGSIVMNSNAVIQNCLGNTNGVGVRIEANGSLTMNDGAVIQNCSANSGYVGGAVFSRGIVTMNGGEISNNNGTHGGGIYAAEKSNITINSGKVSNNSGSNGGGIFAGSDSNITINGGEVSRNKSDFGGGFFMNSKATIAMYDGKISGNSSVIAGGGVVISDIDSLFTLYGGEITQNISAQGGGIYAYNNGARFVMKGGIISNNTAEGGMDLEGLGGGLFLHNGSAGEIYAGIFTGNKTIDSSGGHGGAIYTSSATNTTIYNSIITNNDASNQGGGIWICSTGRAQANEFRGIIVYDNSVGTLKNGKDIHLNSSHTIVTLSNTALGGGTISWRDERSESFIDNLVDLKGVLNLSAEVSLVSKEKALEYATVFIQGNTSSYNGGGVAINGNATFGGVTPEKIDLIVSKVWNEESQEKCPESIKVYMEINGIKQDDSYVILDSNNNWKESFKDLPYNDKNGNIIRYSVAEEVPSNYVVGYSNLKVNNDGNYEIIITNTFSEVAEHVSKRVRKVWDDQDNKYKRRPDSVTVQLYADGAAYSEAVILNSSKSWIYKWDNLPKYNSDKTEIVYTIKEIKIGDVMVTDNTAAGYEVKYETENDTGIDIITNTLVPEDLSFRKIDLIHTEKGLPGAKFTLYACDFTAYNHEHSEYVTDEMDCCWKEIGAQISGEDGLVAFNALYDSEYMLVEDEAPKGYQRSVGQWLIRIDCVQGLKSITTVGPAFTVLTKKDDHGNIIEYLLPNEKDIELPLTGGIGQIQILTVMGVGMVCIGFTIYVFMSAKKLSATIRRRLCQR